VATSIPEDLTGFCA